MIRMWHMIVMAVVVAFVSAFASSAYDHRRPRPVPTMSPVQATVQYLNGVCSAHKLGTFVRASGHTYYYLDTLMCKKGSLHTIWEK